MKKEIYIITGKISDVARRIVGGICFTSGYEIPPCNINQIEKLSAELRELIDRYDELILEEVEK
jgi:hypothetical protein